MPPDVATVVPMPGDRAFPMSVERLLKQERIDEEQAEKLLTKHAAHDHRQRDDGRSHSWMPVRITATASDPPEPPTIGEFTYSDRVHVWSGEPESAKSMIALAVAVAVVRAGGTVLYDDLENGARETLTRLLALGLTTDQIDRGFIYVAPTEPIKAVRDDVVRLIETRRPTLVIIDSYTASLTLNGCDPDRAVDVERHAREVVAPLRASGAAVVLIDHVVKNREARGRYSIASERKVGIADVHLGFTVVTPFGRGRRGVVKLVTHKDRPGWLHRPGAAEVELVSDPLTHAITCTIRVADDTTDSADGFRPTHLMTKISRFLEVQAEPVSRQRVLDAVPNKSAYVRQAIDVLVAEGYATESDGPRNARPLTSLRPFADDDLGPTSAHVNTPHPGPTPAQQEAPNDAA